jgi:Alpha-acetolactate decarboxylase
MMRFMIILGWIAVLSVGIAGAQHVPKTGPPEGTSTDVTGPGLFSVTVHGAFRNMMQKEDYSPKVQLRAIMKSGATEAVGAAAGLKGEITAIDGQLLLTYGTPCASCGHPGAEFATLLAAAKVLAWQQPVPLPSDLVGKDLDSFIVESAKTAGLDLGRPFPVRLSGTLIGVRMHVVRGVNPGFKGHGSTHPMADQEDIATERIDGEVVGFYAPQTAQGIISHPGEPFHYHWVDRGRTRTAHLDAFGMAKGAILVLPKP